MKNLQVTEKVQLSVGLKFTFMGVDLSSYYKKTADGYQIFRSTSRKKGYTLIADTKKTSYSDNTVVPGRKYYYRIRAYARSRYNDIVYSPYSQVKNQTLKPEKAQIRSLKKKSSKTYLLSWRKVPGADGLSLIHI